jgi:transposase
MKKEELVIRKKIFSLHKKKKSTREIAYLLDISKSKSAYWVKRLNDGGSIEDKPRSGKPSKITSLQLKSLKKYFLNNCPDRYGGESFGWTTKLAIRYVKDTYGVVYSVRRMQELFHKFGLSLVTPRNEAYKGSKLARNSFRDEFKKNSKKNIWVPKSLILTKQHLD